ncbi:iron-siderophore ABC transporter substrate-binding protein [Streptomyces tateyamensis]|uniref:Iron-siderophore ABC transporter substrate-binding protein n=1 Tax=Streptomyces tateyamensis TaxID=565073 RepID=A0A2V4NXL9_9ACTN|nr:ABC transporter substrate-binding protein [Streptomyces tateyamensis]PYC85394.1 iron-siderophore ABC transporter substrate-binding protein [Streptomyces tateyamensis]
MRRRTLLTAPLAALPLAALPLAGCGPRGNRPLPQADPPVPGATVTAATGPVPVAGRPVRVVVLDTAELDSAMTLGITPLGASRPGADPGPPDYWPASRLAEVADTGTVGAPDHQRIRALQPQLILGNQTRDGAHYEALRAIAPTVLTATTGHPWKENFQLHARALGREAAAELVAEAYRGHLAQVSRALGGPGALGGRRVSLVRFVEGGRVRLYARQNYLGTILADLQLGRPDAQNTDQFDVEVAPDQLAGADGDLLLYAAYGDPAASGAAAVLAGAAWRGLGAVRAHRAYQVDDRLWFEGIGYTGANLVLGQLQCLLGG